MCNIKQGTVDKWWDGYEGVWEKTQPLTKRIMMRTTDKKNRIEDDDEYNDQDAVDNNDHLKNFWSSSGVWLSTSRRIKSFRGDNHYYGGGVHCGKESQGDELMMCGWLSLMMITTILVYKDDDDTDFPRW